MQNYDNLWIIKQAIPTLTANVTLILRRTTWTVSQIFHLLQIDFVFDAEELQELMFKLDLP